MQVFRLLKLAVYPAIVFAGYIPLSANPEVQTRPRPETIFSGPITASFVERYVALQDKGNIYVVSTGGDAESAIDLGNQIIANGSSVTIAGACLSACAEIILPAASAASGLHFRGKPLIGFHHNTLIKKRVFERIGRQDYNYCYKNLFESYNKFREKVGIKDEVSIIQAKILNVQYVINKNSEFCENTDIKYEFRFWFPNSNQLNYYWNIKHTGEICSEDIFCMARVLEPISEIGDKYVIGIDSYVIVLENSKKILKKYIS